MGRYRKEVTSKRTSVTINEELLDLINSDRRGPQETQAQVIKRWYMGGGAQSYQISLNIKALQEERDYWEKESEEKDLLITQLQQQWRKEVAELRSELENVKNARPQIVNSK